MSTFDLVIHMKKQCERCKGRLFLDSWDQACMECKERGTSVCENCWVHFEWSCINCGGVEHLPRIRRRQVREIIQKGSPK